MIGLLDIKLGHVRCQIQNFNLASVPPYRALSYAWGDTTTREISLNGHPLEVRTNLWAALAHLPLTGYGTKSSSCREDMLVHEKPWIWIDALCINQNSTEERNHQVRLMGRIYAEASEVIVWLGCEELNGGFELLPPGL